MGTNYFQVAANIVQHMLGRFPTTVQYNQSCPLICSIYIIVVMVWYCAVWGCRTARPQTLVYRIINLQD